MFKTSNILIIGAGTIGSIRAKTIKDISPSSKIYIFDIDSKRATELAKEVNGIPLKTLKEGLENRKIEIAIVSVINKEAKNICIKALKSNKHVLCEKPMGKNYKEALEIFNVIKNKKKKFKCGFNHRYHPAILEAYKTCKKGVIGKLMFIRAAYGHGGRKGYDKEWRAIKSLSGGGEFLDQGSHLIDLSLWFFGFEKIQTSHSIIKTLFWDMEVDDNAFIIFETKSGKVAQINASCTQWKNMFRFEIYGTEGAIEVNGLGKSYGTETIKIYKRHKLGAVPEITEMEFKGADMSWALEWKDFIQSLKSKNRLPMSNHIESLEVMKTISSLYKQ